MELIEKMARAIMDHRSPMQPGLQWNIESDENRDWYRGLAQAALTALIEHAGGDGVTEGDREAAANYEYGNARDTIHYRMIFSGQHDDHPAVQAFARHRATAFAAGRAARDREIVEWLRGQEFNYECGFGDDGVRASAIGMAADAIERGEV